MSPSSVRRRQDPSNDRLSVDRVAGASWDSGTRATRRVNARSPHHSSRSFHHSAYSAARIAAERELSVSVCLPARECASTVAEIVRALTKLRGAGVIDEVVVIDAASADDTAALAERAGATVWQEAELMRAFGPVLGKGDAMWRALSVLGGDLVCFLDADSEGFSAHFVTGLLGPLVCESGVSFVKGFYRRPFVDGGGTEADGGGTEADGGVTEADGGGTEADGGVTEADGGVTEADGGGTEADGGVTEADGGGRVNRLTARPALELFYPQLGDVRQPLAGEMAARRDLLERLPFAVGYGVEIAMLIDVWREVGLEGIAQVDLDEHRHRHQPLSALEPMAVTVLATIVRRLEKEGRLTGARAMAAERGEACGHAPPERPPFASLPGVPPAKGFQNGRAPLRRDPA
jgi:glucosyl-3-phosphoglycerate synthase